jgi:pimeloyl-ACP methyl ester carboxylesterase
MTQRQGSLLKSIAYSINQPAGVVLIRDPDQRRYRPAEPVSATARELWPFGVMSSNAYSEPSKMEAIEGWRRWTDFPDEGLQKKCDKQALHFDIWETVAAPRAVAIAFRGTRFEDRMAWKANLRWVCRFLPRYEDQYTVVVKDVAVAFVERLASLNVDDVIATGHSLGGGLAQQFAYALPRSSSSGVKVPRVSRVYAFAPSLVTGWYSVEKDTREHNAKDLLIDRIFDHGEILAFFRLLQSYVYPPSPRSPAVREIRFNLIPSFNNIRNHSMLELAHGLRAAASDGTTEVAPASARLAV